VSLFSDLSGLSLTSTLHDVTGFIDSGPGYVVTVAVLLLGWAAWRNLMN